MKINQSKLKIFSILLLSLSSCSPLFAAMKSGFDPMVLSAAGIDPALPGICNINPDAKYTVKTFLKHEIVKKSTAAKTTLKILAQTTYKNSGGYDHRIYAIDALTFIQQNIGVDQAKKYRASVLKDEDLRDELERRKKRYKQDKKDLDDQAQRDKIIEAAKMKAL